MTRLEFMKELESLLSDIPFDEREEALQYYNGYFDDAGEEHEQEVIEELVSPKRVAAIIKADLNANAADRDNMGCFTEKGYQDTSYKDEKYELVGARKKASDNNQDNTYNDGNKNSADAGSNTYNNYSRGKSNTNHSYGYGQEQKYSSEQARKAADERSRNSNIALILILCCTVGLPFILSAFGIFVGIVTTIIGLIIGFGAAGVAMMVGGIALIIAGLIQLSVPALGLLFCGSGLLVLGLGMLLTVACVALCKNVLPAMVKGVVNLCRRPFQNRSVTA